jgi:hypothetical protein
MMELIKKKKKEKNFIKTETLKNTSFRNHRKFSLLIKVLGLFLRCPILVMLFKQKLMWSHQVTGL